MVIRTLYLRKINLEESYWNLKLRLFTRGEENEFIQTALEAETNFIEGSTYIDQYLNKRGVDSYRDLDVFMGCGSPAVLPSLGLDHVVESTKFTVGKIRSDEIDFGQLGEGFASGVFTINGKEIHGLEVEPNNVLEANDLKLWLKPQVDELGIKVDAETEIIIDPKNIVPTAGLVINGTTIVAEEALLSLTADSRTVSAELNTRDKTVRKLRDLVNDQTHITGVGSYVDPEGFLVINNRTGKNIEIAGVSASNILSLTSTEYTGVIEMTRVVDQIRRFPKDMNFEEGLTINNVNLGEKGAFSDVEAIRDTGNKQKGRNRLSFGTCFFFHR